MSFERDKACRRSAAILANVANGCQRRKGSNRGSRMPFSRRREERWRVLTAPEQERPSSEPSSRTHPGGSLWEELEPIRDTAPDLAVERLRQFVAILAQPVVTQACD